MNGKVGRPNSQFERFPNHESSNVQPTAYAIPDPHVKRKPVKNGKMYVLPPPPVHDLFYDKGAQIFQKSTSHLKFNGDRSVKRNKFHTVDPQMLGSTVQNSVAMATCRSLFVQPCFTSMHYCIAPTMCVARTAVDAFAETCNSKGWLCISFCFRLATTQGRFALRYPVKHTV